MSFDFATCSVEDLWHLVAAHLAESGISVVLVGGAVVSVYSNDAYQSGDLDFVREALFIRQDVESVMAAIGFEKRHRHFVHQECSHLFVEFVSGPVGIGDDTQITPDTVDVDGVTIKLLSPTDCVRDRLAGFIHYGTRDMMNQAVLVARSNSVDWNTIEK
jgi:hypothetical protein